MAPAGIISDKDFSVIAFIYSRHVHYTYMYNEMCNTTCHWKDFTLPQAAKTCCSSSSDQSDFGTLLDSDSVGGGGAS